MTRLDSVCCLISSFVLLELPADVDVVPAACVVVPRGTALCADIVQTRALYGQRGAPVIARVKTQSLVTAAKPTTLCHISRYLSYYHSLVWLDAKKASQSPAIFCVCPCPASQHFLPLRITLATSLHPYRARISGRHVGLQSL